MAKHPQHHAGPRSPARRRLLAGILSAYTAALMPWALAEPIDDEPHGAFIALSALLAGRKVLDRDLGARLYEALRQEDPGFPEAVRSLLALIEQRQIDPLVLQQVLDDSQSPLAAVPRKLVYAWYMGIVGEGDHARVIAYEHALNAVVVSDVLKPPTYAYGAYGSWTRKPT